jgi:alcohol dehydrogenase
MIAAALGGRVVAVDIRSEPLALARQLGAEVVLNAHETLDVPAAIHEITGCGADVSLDALGSALTFRNSILSLRKRGRHVQVGLLNAEKSLPSEPLSRLIAWELEIAGSHGLQAQAYPGLLAMIEAGKLDPSRLVDRTIMLDEAPSALESLDDFRGCGVAVVTPTPGLPAA